MLERTLLHFGLPVTVGNTTSHFILRTLIETQGTINPSGLARVHNPSNHSFLLSLLVKVTPQNQDSLVDLGFSQRQELTGSVNGDVGSVVVD